MDRFRVGQGTLDGEGVVEGNQRSFADGLDVCIAQEPDRDGTPANLKAVGADDRVGDVLADVGVHPLDDGHHGHQEGHGDDHAEQREE